jgi:acetyl-CoA carboxylase beta subunit
VLICKHCGTPIKPVDIFEKIKSLIQSDFYSKPIPERQQNSNQGNLCTTCSKIINKEELSRNNGVCNDCWDTAKMNEDGLS